LGLNCNYEYPSHINLVLDHVVVLPLLEQYEEEAETARCRRTDSWQERVVAIGRVIKLERTLTVGIGEIMDYDRKEEKLITMPVTKMAVSSEPSVHTAYVELGPDAYGKCL